MMMMHAGGAVEYVMSLGVTNEILKENANQSHSFI